MTVKTLAGETRLQRRVMRKAPAYRRRIASAGVEAQAEKAMKVWLGLAARKAREEAKLVRSQIAGQVPCAETTIRNFEIGKSLPRQLTHVLGVYARESGLESKWDIWQRAIDIARKEEER